MAETVVLQKTIFVNCGNVFCFIDLLADVCYTVNVMSWC